MDEIRFYDIKKEYGFLSNFWKVDINVDGVWPTSEHYFQGAKFMNIDALHDEYVEEIRLCSTPGKAFILGRMKIGGGWKWRTDLNDIIKKYNNVKMRVDWDDVKDDIMRFIVGEKFKNPVLKKKLLSTGDRVLIEHTSRDSYWGDGGDGTGLNQSANLTFYDVTTAAIPLNALRNDADCSLQYCSIVEDLGGDDYAFNVSQFTNYSLELNSPPTAYSDVTLVSTNSTTNNTLQNLSVTWTEGTDADDDQIYNITDWRLDDVSIAILNMPFDTNRSGQTGAIIKDYSTNENNGTFSGFDWDADSGWRDASNCVVGGCYELDGTDNYIEITDDRN